MKIVLVGREFDFASGDGISRYSYEIYKGIRKYVDVKTVSTGNKPRPLRALVKIKIGDAQIAHLMYPDAARITEKEVKVASMWHDLRMLTKYSKEGQQRYKPKIVERLGIANAIVRMWVSENYEKSDIIFCNSSQTLKEIKNYFTQEGTFDDSKMYVITPLGIGASFLRTKPWKGERRDFAYIGSIHLRHKNLTGLLDVFDKVAAKSNHRLHIFTSSLRAENLLKEAMSGHRNLSEKNVILHFKSSDLEVLRYLPKLIACLHLTRYEGLGMPILESLAVGTNVVVLKESTIPDEAKKYALQFRESEVAGKILQLARKPSSAIPSAVKYARGFTWKNTIRKTLSAYRKVLDKSRG